MENTCWVEVSVIRFAFLQWTPVECAWESHITCWTSYGCLLQVQSSGWLVRNGEVLTNLFSWLKHEWSFFDKISCLIRIKKSWSGRQRKHHEYVNETTTVYCDTICFSISGFPKIPYLHEKFVIKYTAKTSQICNWNHDNVLWYHTFLN